MKRWLEECETEISEATEEDIKAASIIHVRTFLGGFLAFLLELHLFAFPLLLSLSKYRVELQYEKLFSLSILFCLHDFLSSLNHFHITLFWGECLNIQAGD